MGSDAELLRRYVDGSQEAFAEIVRRYLNLVYSAARRQTQSTHAAEDVAQAAFVYLSKNAAKIDPDVPLAAWFHLTTRHLALNAVRTEARRRARERAAHELSTMNAQSPDWTKLEPLLDEAVATLSETDRAAVLGRYFAGHSLREVGAQLGVSDDAAQKRVSRALEHLRDFFLKRGIPVSSAALATDLSAHVIEAAPAALGAAIAADAALSTTIAVAAVQTTKALFMTSFQKTLVAGAFTIAITAGVYEASALQTGRREIDLQAEQARRLREEIARARAGIAPASLTGAAQRRETAVLPAGVTNVAAITDAATEAELVAWVARDRALRQSFEANPGLKIPELEFLQPTDWAAVVIRNRLESPEDVRRAQAEARHRATGRFASLIGEALKGYAQANDGMLPAAPADLQPYFSRQISPAVLSQYAMTRAGKIYPDNAPGTAPVSGEIMVKTGVVDPAYDLVEQIYPSGGTAGSIVYQYWATQARIAFTHDNAGRRPTEVRQLERYLPESIDRAKVADFLQIRPTP